MKVGVIGGGKVGYYLVKTLLERGHKVILIEKDPFRADKIAEQLGIPVINCDGSDLAALENAEIDQVQVLAIVTGKDEDNLITAQVAQKYLQVPRIIVRVNNPKNEEIFHVLGVEVTVSSTGVISNLIEVEATNEELKTLLTLHRGTMTLVEATLKTNSPVVNKKVKDIASRLPKGCVLVSVLREDTVIFPRGDTTLQVGDEVIAVTTLKDEELLEKALIGRLRNGV